MIKRYPHNAKIIISTEIDDDTGINETDDKEIVIKGRYEPTGQTKALDYKAKFFCGKLKDIKPFEIDGQKLVYADKEFTIVQLHNYQTHCELWLD
ncbi:MAG: hypothetical protein KGV59_05440 [Tenacibaculum sp.]|nr:hypothetical protein [Tenacibaculum sp.]